MIWKMMNSIAVIIKKTHKVIWDNIEIDKNLKLRFWETLANWKDRELKIV